MIKVITYGTFDLFHEGHKRILERAKALGDYLIVGVTSDSFDIQRGKLNTHDSLVTRIEAVRASGFADEVIVEEYRGQKIHDILHYGVDIFTVGSDWEGKFDYLKQYCKVVYLDRTQGISSTDIRSRNTMKVGIVGTGSIASRFVPESKFVTGLKIEGAYNPDTQKCDEFCARFDIPYSAPSYEDLLRHCEVIYVASPHYTHYQYVKAALLRGRHVLCETPLVLEEAQCRELLELSRKTHSALMLAHKTAYCPAFSQLMYLVKSGAIGDIVDINASVTTLTPETSEKMSRDKFGGSMNENACFPLLPIIKLLGDDFKNLSFYSKIRNGVDIYTKAIFVYEGATASFQVGLGAKTEGNLVISGTKGYVYVPAPWWKTDYFELRFEDQNKNRRLFFPFDGDGLRYELRTFVDAIQSGLHRRIVLNEDELLAMSRVQDMFLKGENLTILK